MENYPVWRGPAGGLEPADRERVDAAIALHGDLTAAMDCVAADRNATQEAAQAAAEVAASEAAAEVRAQVAQQADRAEAAAGRVLQFEVAESPSQSLIPLSHVDASDDPSKGVVTSAYDPSTGQMVFGAVRTGAIQSPTVDALQAQTAAAADKAAQAQSAAAGVAGVAGRTAQFEVAEGLTGTLVPIWHTALTGDDERGVVIGAYDTATGEVVFDRVRLNALSGVQTGGGGSVINAATYEALPTGQADGTVAQVLARGTTANGPGLYERAGGAWVKRSAMTIAAAIAAAGVEEVADDPYGAPLMDGYVILKHVPAPDDPTRAVVIERYNRATGQIETLATSGTQVEYLPWRKTPETAYPQSVLVNPTTGVTVPPLTNDNDGLRKVNRAWDPSAIYVVCWMGQSLNSSQSNLERHPGKDDNTAEYQAAYERAYTPLSTVAGGFNPNPAKCLMPSTGSHIAYQTPTGLVPLESYRHVPAATSTPAGETPVAQGIFEIYRRLKADFPDVAAADMPMLLGINCARGGSSIVDLGPGRPMFAELIKFMRWLVGHAKTLNKRVVLLAGQYRGFEADNDIVRPFDPWSADAADPSILKGREKMHLMRMMSRLQENVEEAVLPITGQTERVRVFFDQVQIGNSTYTSIDFKARSNGAQLDVREINPFCIAQGSKAGIPMNLYDYVHPSPEGYAFEGQFDGSVIYREMFSNMQYIELRVVEAWRSGAATIDLRFSRHATLLPDDSIVNVTDLGPGKGVQIIGDALLPISGVTFVTPETLRVTLTSAPAAQLRDLRATIGLISDGNRRGNRWGARSAIVAGYGATIAPHFTPVHQPRYFAGEANNQGRTWFDYGGTFKAVDMAAHQLIRIEA